MKFAKSEYKLVACILMASLQLVYLLTLSGAADVLVTVA